MYPPHLSGASTSSGLPISTKSSIHFYSESTIPLSSTYCVFRINLWFDNVASHHHPLWWLHLCIKVLDTSFSTSFLKPSSALSSLDELPTIPETLIAPSLTIPSSTLWMLSSPSSLSFQVLTTIGDLSRMTSSVSYLISSIFNSQSLVDFKEPSAVPFLHSTCLSLVSAYIFLLLFWLIYLI